ncbi:hypothetical protein [Streptomyces vastus]|uniref:DUF3558 domain-containing protein n=1 Tax=Streptomyces vastus TaxID=285451 RepID=A0ABP6DEE1_9ACTN
MTEPSARRALRKPFVYGVVAVVAAMGLLVAYLLGVFEKRGDIKADDVCSNLPDRQAAADIFNSALPRAASYNFVMRATPIPDWHYISHCTGTGDGDNLLNLNAKVGPARSWRTWADRTLPPTSGGKRTYFNAGIKGVSTADLAAVYVPCYRSEKTSKARYNMTVFAQAPQGLEGSDNEARKTLIDLATALGRYAHEEAKCDLPSKLPG